MDGCFPSWKISRKWCSKQQLKWKKKFFGNFIHVSKIFDLIYSLLPSDSFVWDPLTHLPQNFMPSFRNYFVFSLVGCVKSHPSGWLSNTPAWGGRNSCGKQADEKPKRKTRNEPHTGGFVKLWHSLEPTRPLVCTRLCICSRLCMPLRQTWGNSNLFLLVDLESLETQPGKAKAKLWTT